MSVLDLVKLSKALQEQWGVSAAPVMVAAAPRAAAAGGAAEAAAPVEEQTEFTVIAEGDRPEQDQRHQGGARTDRPGPEGGQGPGRGRARAVKEGVTKDEANAAKAKLEEAGAKAEVK